MIFSGASQTVVKLFLISRWVVDGLGVCGDLKFDA